MRNITTVILSLILPALMMAQNPAYQIYNNQGEQVTYQQTLQALQASDVVLFGELHNNPVCHWLQLEITQDLYQMKDTNLVIGAEMFERDDQAIINEYFKDLISQRSFEREAKLWDNYQKAYKPLVEFAKDSGLKFVATNIPRRYADYVASHGLSLDSLAEKKQQWFAPLPIEVNMELASYQEMMNMGGGHGIEHMVHAQAVKDATMAHFINQYLEAEETLFHLNGTFHSKYNEGIYWYLNKYNPDLKVTTLNSAEQKHVTELQQANQKLGDFILTIPDNMTKPY